MRLKVTQLSFSMHASLAVVNTVVRFSHCYLWITYELNLHFKHVPSIYSFFNVCQSSDMEW